MPVDQSIYESEQGEGVSSFTRMNATFGSLIIILLTLLQLKSENKDATPFEAHGLVMRLFILTMLIYAFVAVAVTTVQARFTNNSLVLVVNQLCFFDGFLAWDLLLLILAPPFGYFFLVIWLLLLLLVLLYYLFTIGLYRFLCHYTVYNEVRERFQIWYGGLFLHATSQASTTSPMAPTSIQQQNGFGETSENSNEMNV